MIKQPIELLAPAGDLEKLKTAVRFGADAVYFGGEIGGLRAGAGNLSIPEIAEAMEFLHLHQARGYLTLNIYPHREDLEPMKAYLEEIKSLPIDAFIVSDPGVMSLLREIIPDAEIHVSTQANTTNLLTAKFWASQPGVKRIVTAREMTLREIRDMREGLPEDIEIEAFVHGAMCMSYSGRCLLSNFMTGRDANRGACSHPCRWKYVLMEEKRPGEYYPVEEDGHGSYILNSRDICMIEHLPDLIEAGVMSLKIEGRMKSSFYVATVVAAYRTALDTYITDPEHYAFKPEWMNELRKASHREFTCGFYYGKEQVSQNYATSDYERDYSFIGVVLGQEGEYTIVEQRNKFSVGDAIEVFGPRTMYVDDVVEAIWDEEGNPMDSAPHPQQVVRVKLARTYPEHFLLRKKK